MAYLLSRGRSCSRTVAIGVDPLKSLTTGTNNIAIGTSAADALTTGACNIAMGINALGAHTDGCDNVAIGQSALAASADDGDNNIAIGKTAMGGADVSGADNIALGTTSMDALTSGACNIALGINALGAGTTGALNIAIGNGALGGADVAIGGGACGCDNVAIGTGALAATTTGSQNVAIGIEAMCASVGEAARNVAIGACALASNADAGNLYNVVIGDYAMANCTGAAQDNVAIGRTALRVNRSGDYNIAIGYRAGCGVTTEDKTINIGCEANQTTASVACIVAVCVMAPIFTATSDCRSKKDIKDLPYGLDFINLLRPVSYKWKPQADKLDKDGNLLEKGEGAHTHQRTMFGLLGQQVREATKKLGLNYNDFSGFHDQEYENRNNPNWKKSYTMENKTIQLSYDDFIAPLIKSVQELSAEVDSLKEQLKTT